MTQYISQECRTDVDIQCTPLTDCTSTEFEEVPELGRMPYMDRDCKAVTPPCDTTVEYLSREPTWNADRVCVPFTPCLENQFEFRPPTVNADRICTNLTSCAANQFESLARSGFLDRECQNITECTEGQQISINATENSNAECEDVVPVSGASGSTDQALGGGATAGIVVVVLIVLTVVVLGVVSSHRSSASLAMPSQDEDSMHVVNNMADDDFYMVEELDVEVAPLSQTFIKKPKARVYEDSEMDDNSVINEMDESSMSAGYDVYSKQKEMQQGYMDVEQPVEYVGSNPGYLDVEAERRRSSNVSGLYQPLSTASLPPMESHAMYNVPVTSYNPASPYPPNTTPGGYPPNTTPSAYTMPMQIVTPQQVAQPLMVAPAPHDDSDEEDTKL